MYDISRVRSLSEDSASLPSPSVVNFVPCYRKWIPFSNKTFVSDASNGLTKNFMGFSVYLSNTTNKTDGVLCFRDTIYSRDTIPNPVIITCPYHGRFVIYYNNRTHYPYPDGYSDTVAGALCEVEVYGQLFL